MHLDWKSKVFISDTKWQQMSKYSRAGKYDKEEHWVSYPPFLYVLWIVSVNRKKTHTAKDLI